MAGFDHAIIPLRESDMNDLCHYTHKGTIKYRNIGYDIPLAPAAVARTYYKYVTGKRGRISSQHRSACADHIRSFAKKHGIVFEESV